MTRSYPRMAAMLCGGALLLSIGLVQADDTRPADTTPVYGDGADLPANDPVLKRPQTADHDHVDVRQGPSGPDIGPGAERDSLVPIPEDNDGRIDPQ